MDLVKQKTKQLRSDYEEDTGQEFISAGQFGEDSFQKRNKIMFTDPGLNDSKGRSGRADSIKRTAQINTVLEDEFELSRSKINISKLIDGSMFGSNVAEPKKSTSTKAQANASKKKLQKGISWFQKQKIEDARKQKDMMKRAAEAKDAAIAEDKRTNYLKARQKAKVPKVAYKPLQKSLNRAKSSIEVAEKTADDKKVEKRS